MTLRLDESLVLRAISIADASILLALDLREYLDDPKIPASEVDTFLRTCKQKFVLVRSKNDDPDSGLGRPFYFGSDQEESESWLDPYPVTKKPLPPTVAKHATRLEALMSESVLNKELVADHLALSLDGTVEAENTWVDLTSLNDWLSRRGFDPYQQELFHEYERNESVLIDILGEVVVRWRKRQDLGLAVPIGGLDDFGSRAFEVGGLMGRDVDLEAGFLAAENLTPEQRSTLSILRHENRNLLDDLNEIERRSTAATEQAEKPLATRERHSLHAVILGLLDLLPPEDKEMPYKLARRIAHACELRGVQISDDNVAQKLRAALNLLDRPN
ncbi:MAG: hypothetical protein JNM50_03945 [Chromatiales bacterium]|nr:hypothetical protein [Chromatiales bacterium]